MTRARQAAVFGIGGMVLIGIGYAMLANDYFSGTWETLPTPQRLEQVTYYFGPILSALVGCAFFWFVHQISDLSDSARRIFTLALIAVAVGNFVFALEWFVSNEFDTWWTEVHGKYAGPNTSAQWLIIVGAMIQGLATIWIARALTPRKHVDVNQHDGWSDPDA